MTRKIVAIWAEDKNGVIGVDGHLPWRLPAELALFKARTMGADILMGRKTFDGMQRRVLPGRQTFVLTRDQSFVSADRVTVVHSREEALSISLKDLYIIGGAEIFQLFKDDFDELYQTVVDGSFEGDTTMPDLGLGKTFVSLAESATNVKEKASDLSASDHPRDSVFYPADRENPYAFTVTHWRRHV